MLLTSAPHRLRAEPAGAGRAGLLAPTLAHSEGQEGPSERPSELRLLRPGRAPGGNPRAGAGAGSGVRHLGPRGAVPAHGGCPGTHPAVLRAGPAARPLWELLSPGSSPDPEETSEEPLSVRAEAQTPPLWVSALVVSTFPAWVPGCLSTWVPGCEGAWVCGCVGTWVCGCLGA